MLFTEKSLTCVHVGIHKLLVKYQETGTVVRHSGSGRPPNVTETIKIIVEEQTRKDDETLASQPQMILTDRGFHISFTLLKLVEMHLPWEHVLPTNWR